MFRSMIAERPWVALLGAVVFVVVLTAVMPKCGVSKPGKAGEDVAVQAPSSEVAETEAKGAESARMDQPGEDSEAAAAPEAGAGGGPWLNVVGVVPLEAEPLKDQIVFFFDGPIVAPEQVNGQAVTAFTIEPDPGGAVRVGDNFIGYRSPNIRSAVYTVTLSEHIQSRDGRNLNPANREYRFGGFSFRPEKVWQIGSDATHSTVGIVFPTQVKLDDLKQHLAVVAEGGAPTAYELREGSTPSIAQLILPGDTKWPVTITVSKGLPDATGALHLVEDFTYKYPTERYLQVTSCHWGDFTPEYQQVQFRFSRPVVGATLGQYLSITDGRTNTAVPFEVVAPEANDNHAVTVHLATLEGVKLVVRLAKGLAGTEGVSLGGDFETTLEKRPTPLELEQTWWQTRGRDGLVLVCNLDRSVDIREIREHFEVQPALANMRIEPTYGEGFQVYGDWDSKRTYEIRLKAGTKDREGLTLGETRARPVQAEEVPAYVGFGFGGKYYFPRHVAGGVLPLETRNVDKVTLVLHRMFPNNIAVAVNDTKAETGSYEGEDGYYGDQETGLGAFAQSWSEEVAKKEVPPVRAPDRIAATPVKVDEIFPADKKGVYCLEATGERTTGENRTSVQAWKLALFTEIGVLAHWQEQELVVFAHNLFSLEPLPLAKVTAYSSKNQVLGQGNTDNAGVARLGPFDAALGEPHVIVVECDHDYTFLELEAREDASSSKPEDMEAYNREGYDAFLYADRDLYRPGETVHLRWFVRKNFGDVVANVPLLVTVVKPNGRDLLTQTTTLSDVGSAGMDLETQKTYPTGKYRAKLTVPGSDRSIGEYTFSVEEFVPNRIKTAVTVTAAEGAAADYLLPDQEYTIGVNAQHLFGAPASDRKSEALVVVMRGQFAPKEWAGFRFGNDAEFQSTTIQCGEAQTDEEGNAAFQFTYEAPPKVTFPLKAVALGRVFELGGRAVASTVEKSLFPSDVCLGVAADTKSQAGGVQVTAAAVKPDGSAAELDKVTITLERRVWNYYVRRYYSHHEPNWTESFEEVESKEVAVAAGRGTAAFAPKDYGYYRVRVHSDKTPQFSAISFYSYGNRFQLAETGEPSLVKLTLDKERYEVGDEASIRIESPFDGRGIVVLQTDHILDMIPVAIQNGAGVAKFRADNEHVPNVWAEVTIIHAVKTKTTQVYPFSSFGMVSVPVRDKRRELRVGFPSLPEEIRPGTKAEIQVATTDSGGAAMPAEITLAAVDEGIHSITDYQNPDPFGWLCRPRQADYRRAHYYDKVAYDFEKPAAGGDMLLKMAKRLGATDETWIKSVALWSGAVRTDAEGKALVTLDVPEFTGQLRLVAVGCSAGDQARPAAFGTTSGKMFVRRTYMMRTSMSRFLLPGDTIHCRANLFNHSDAACKATVSWQGVGALQESAGSKELDIAARGEADCTADFVAGAASGQGEIRWTAVILDAAGNEVERLIENDPIPVRAPAAFQSKHELAILKPGESRTFRNQAFLDDARTELEISVGASPQMRLEEALKHVVRYPYGCVEQTTSALMPMYVLRKDATLTGSVIDQALPVNSYIEAGIRRLFSMQTSSGGLSLWVGGTTPYPYGSIYALHFLTLVKQGREFDLPKTSFEALQDYVRTLIGMAAPQGEEMPYFPTNHQSVLFQRAYAIYVLALDGDLDAIHEIQRFDTVELPTAARFLLAAALAQNTRDVDRVRLYLTSAPSKPHTVTEPDGTLNSDIRNTAIELLAMLQMADTSAEAAQQKLEKADMLIAWLEKSRYGTTQESAFAVTALGAYFDEIAANIAAAAATIEAPKGPKTIQGPAVFRDSFNGPAGVFTVTNTGGADLFVDFTTRGVPEKVEWKEVREGMAVQRQFLTSAGKPYADTVFHQGDTYIVQVTLTCAKQLPLKNVVVADLLPAGFEVENPRLDTTVMAGANLPNAIVPSYLDIRDDRVVTAYDAISDGTVHFYYVVRAVTPGTYQYPPIQAECMYDAAVRGVSMPSAMEVK